MKNKTEKMLTIEDILKRKEFYTKRRTKNILLKLTNLGQCIEVKPLEGEILEEVTEMVDENEVEAAKYAVFHSCVKPDLKDEKLKKALGCVTPFDVVDAIFQTGEISDLAKQIISISGYNTVEKIDDLENL